MGETEELSIKNKTFYFYDDMINIKKINSNWWKKHKKPYKDFDIYYIGYITIKKFHKFSDYENIHSVNPLYLIIHSSTGYFKEKNGEKYLIFDLIDNYEGVFLRIKSEIETIDSEKLFYEKYYHKIGANTDDHVPLNKKLKFSSRTMIIRCVFQKGKELYSQIYLNECLYQL